MAEVLQKVVVAPNADGVWVEKYIPLSAEEIAQREADALAYAEAEAVREAELAAFEALKESARTKLVAGEPLTAEEAATIVL